MGNFEVLAIMSAENKEILLAPLSNITSAQSGKDGYGRVTIAVPNEVITKLLIDGNYYTGGLLLANTEQFNEIKEANHDSI